MLLADSAVAIHGMAISGVAVPETGIIPAIFAKNSKIL
jgi:hypothetical protein